MSVFLGRSLLLNHSNMRACMVHSNAALIDNCLNINNRNPRNLELMRIARKPSGYHLDKPGRQYWHRLVVTQTTRSLSFEVEHCLNGVVVSASTKEWEIKKRLYRSNDGAAYRNLGRILARRCLESGIMFVHSDADGEKCEKMNLALTEIVNAGIILTEPARYVKPAPWDQERPEKPWEILEK